MSGLSVSVATDMGKLRNVLLSGFKLLEILRHSNGNQKAP